MILLLASCSTLPPKSKKSRVVLDKGFYLIHYSPEFQMPHYVEYTLKAETLRRPKIKRRDRFHVESALVVQMLPALKPDALKHTPYDRGHLAPSADFQWDEKANESTFSMANMVPQSPRLNRGAWKALEEKVRGWACAEEQIRVVTGPVLKPGLPKTSAGVIVPEQFFKLVLDETPPRKAIAFVLNQSDTQANSYVDRVFTVRAVEVLTDEDYFSELPRREQDELETKTDLNEWKEQDCG